MDKDDVYSNDDLSSVWGTYYSHHRDLSIMRNGVQRTQKERIQSSPSDHLMRIRYLIMIMIIFSSRLGDELVLYNALYIREGDE